MASGYTGYTVPYTGNQALIRQRQVMKKEQSIMKMHERTTNVRLNLKPLFHDVTPTQWAMARSVYGVRLKPLPKQLRTYDRIFNLPPDWDQSVKTDAYRNFKMYKLNARKDEENREIPVMSNSEPGHRLLANPDPFKRSPYGRRMVLYKDVYRPNGVSLV